MQPDIDLNWWAIAVAVIASFAIGSLWYGFIVREVWQREMGFTAETGLSTGGMVRGSFINIIGTILMAYVLARWIAAWRPDAWGGSGEADSDLWLGILIPLFAWFGFLVPVMANGVAYERKSWTLFGINATFQLVSVVVMGLILAFWR